MLTASFGANGRRHWIHSYVLCEDGEELIELKGPRQRHRGNGATIEHIGRLTATVSSLPPLTRSGGGKCRRVHARLDPHTGPTHLDLDRTAEPGHPRCHLRQSR